MHCWLLKTEPEEYSFSDLLQDRKAVWDGIRNYQARNNLKKMSCGDMVLVYHTGKEKQIVGIAEVIKEHYSDPEDKTGTWFVIDLKPVKKLKSPFTWDKIKKEKKYQKYPY